MASKTAHFRDRTHKQMTWDEVDLIEGVWRIGAERMKGKREHVVPLSDRTSEILREYASAFRPELMTEGYVFQSRRGPLPLTVFKDVKPLGYTVHGFRSSLGQ